MCFSGEMSGLFSAFGLAATYYVYKNTTNVRLAVGVFYFFLMEFLQFFQYQWIDDCDSQVNKFLTFLGFVHICYQPYFTHIINSSLTRSPKFLQQYEIILRMCLLGGTMLLFRYIAAAFGEDFSKATGHMFFEPGFFSKGNINSDYTIWKNNTPAEGSHKTLEWLRGEELCTYKGNYHLAWSVPMTDVTYWTPSASIHSFLMFGPFFVMKKNMVIQGIFLWLAGPYLAAYITSNLMEQASIWCFFSIAQILIMLFLIREQLLLGWGRDKGDRISVHGSKAATKSTRTRSKSPAGRTRSSRKSD